MRKFPLHPGVLVGIGLGAFFDGIVFHQLLQWHHMLSGWYPTNSLENVRLNTAWDGIFHSFAYVAVLTGLYLFWQELRRGEFDWSSRRLLGALLIGWGVFNLLEGAVDHELLKLHQVNETVPDAHRIYWDIAFLLWGAVMIVIGGAMARQTGEEEEAHAGSSP
jgi:uncharacterized membrane protein